MYSPVMFHHVLLIFWAFFISKKLKSYPGTMKARFLYGLKWFVIIMTIPMAFHAHNFYTILSEERIIAFFPEYKKLDRDLTGDFVECLLSFGPLGRMICPAYYRDHKSLLVPTNENLSKRLNRCRFDGQWALWDFEDEDICKGAVSEVGSFGDQKVQLDIFKRIVDESRDVECRDKESYFSWGISKLKKIDPRIINNYRYEQILDYGCIVTFYDSGRVFYDPAFMAHFNDSFAKLNLDGLSEDLKHNWKVSLIILRFSITRKNILSPGIDGTPRSASRIIYVILNSRNAKKSNQFRDAIEKFLQSELPDLASKYPYSYVTNTDWIDNRIKKGWFNPEQPNHAGFRKIK